MNTIARCELPQGGVRARERNQRHLHHAAPRQGVHRQTHAIDGDRPVQHRRFHDVARHANVDQQRVPVRCYAFHGSEAVDVPLDKMPTQSIADPERTLQIHAPALPPFSDQRASQGGLDGVYGEPTLDDPFYGEASAVHRDALAPLQRLVGRLDTQLHAAVHGDGIHTSHGIYDSGKHSRRSKTNNVSGPKARRSTGIQRGASASGKSGTPGNAGTAPSPSRSCARPCASVSGRKTRTPFASSTDTLAAGASCDATTHVGTSRAVCTSVTPELSIARRSKMTRTGGCRGVMAPRTVSCGLSLSAVVPPTPMAWNPARSQCT